MGLSYGWEKFHKANLSLSANGPLERRLVDAIAYSLIHLKDVDVPSEMLDEFKEFMKNVTSVKATGEEGNITATVRSLTIEEQEKTAEQIVSMYDKVCRAYKK